MNGGETYNLIMNPCTAGTKKKKRGKFVVYTLLNENGTGLQAISCY
jgi:hypothetical protein